MKNTGMTPSKSQRSRSGLGRIRGMRRAAALTLGAATAVALAACSSDTKQAAGSGAADDLTESPSATADAPASDSTGASANGGTPITITAGGQTITATLNDSEVAQDFAEMLPVTVPTFRNYGIEYITELSEPLTETGPFYTDVQPGDIVYYNPRDSITIIYEETSSVPTLTKMGEITSDLGVFDDLPDDVDMLIEVG
ncbi:cyclophilin-like fold protein [Modestobacter marinus]|uniref:cyclophilin-like fold protein n=1 Tax=Modestobacter marinus TaxID=477641 RepID=UPI001C967D19|nr:cyclophilin-like fold protein [Modestobacter marinus]